MVTTRIQTTRRRLGTSRHLRPTRRRRSAWPLLAGVAGSQAAGRLGLAAHARAWAAAGALLALLIVYLVVGAQATQTSYDLDRLKDQNAQLRAEQNQLRYQDARMHATAGVEQAAAVAGLQHGNQPRFVTRQPVAIDLEAPLGPPPPQDTPLWRQALALLGGGPARDAQAAGR